AWEADVGWRTLNLAMISKIVTRLKAVFDEARVRKLFGDRNRGRYTDAVWLHTDRICGNT
ncbi:MAG: hypothetical protein WCB58_21495, partial [Acidobacteriaceae bacterium]